MEWGAVSKFLFRTIHAGQHGRSLAGDGCV